MQQRSFRVPAALVLALLPALVAGCAPSSTPSPEGSTLREGLQPLSASEPYLVRDLDPRNLGSRPDRETSMVNVQGTLFFARDLPSGSELWKSDGTEAGTVRVKRFEPLEGNPSHLTDLGGTLFFYDSDLRTLWKSDGTEAGTVRVTPLKPNGSGPLPPVYAMAVMNGRLYLFDHRSLWVSDGTAAGTLFLFASGSFDAIGRPLAVNGTLFFTNELDGGRGLELWRTDGTATGTVRLGLISAESFSNLSMAELNGTLFFSVAWKLWKSDGTPEGTAVFKEDVPGISTVVAANGRLFFLAANNLWTSDGTVAGTVLTATLPSRPSYMEPTAGGLVFTVQEFDLGETVWRSDGTAAGTVHLHDPCPNPSPTSAPGTIRMASLKGVAFMSIRCAEDDVRLWKSDGTLAGTLLVKQGAPAPALTGLFPESALAVGGTETVLFWADDGSRGPELWKSDGTAEGTVLVRDIETTPASSDPRKLVAVGNTVYFVANDGQRDPGLWKSDGTPGGTVFIRRLSSVGADSLSLAIMNGDVFFTDERTLWKSEGTGAVYFGGFSGSLSSLVNFGGTLFFLEQSTNATKLWKSDGTSSGTVRVKDIPVVSWSQDIRPVVLDGTLYFIVGNGTTRLELWRSNGTDAGTVLVKTLFQDTTVVGSVRSMVVANGALLLLTQGSSRQLWRSDGTEAGTTPLPELTSRMEEPVRLARVGNTLFALSTVSGFKLWKTDGTLEGTQFIQQLVPGVKQANPSDLEQMEGMRGRLYLTVYNALRDRFELWRSDGTAGGTGLVRPLELRPVGVRAIPEPLAYVAEAGKRLFFVRDGGQGREPWALPLAPVDCPFSLQVEATGPEGARVDFPALRRADDVDPSLPASYSHASGSLFPMGSTEVTLSASDPAYPADTCTFTVTVADTTAPELQCPAPLTVESPNGENAVVEYAPATVTDAVLQSVEYSPPSGSTLPVGTTQVEVKATDAAGHSRTCSFSVSVRPRPQGCGCGSTSPAAALGWLLVLAPLVARRRGARGTP